MDTQPDPLPRHHWSRIVAILGLCFMFGAALFLISVQSPDTQLAIEGLRIVVRPSG